MKNGQTLSFAEWTDARSKGQQLFPAIKKAFAEAGISADKINVMAIGLGPGSYSGLRISLSALCAMALPFGTQVYGVSSADALIRSLSKDQGGRDISLIGNARKNRLWMIRGNESGATEGTTAPLRIIKPEELELQASDSLIVCYDWSDMAKVEFIRSSGMMINENDQPADAVKVAELARMRIEKRLPSLPLTPIYVHPAVV